MSPDKDVIINELKSRIIPSRWELNNWDIIFDRKEEVEDGIYLYHCCFDDFYLYEDGTFYDVVNSAPNNNYYKTSDLNDSDLEKVNILKKYVPAKWHDLNNWGMIISRAEEVEDNIIKYPCSFINLYFDKDMNIVEYKEVKFFDGKVYYDMEYDTYDGIGAGYSIILSDEVK